MTEQHRDRIIKLVARAYERTDLTTADPADLVSVGGGVVTLDWGVLDRLMKIVDIYDSHVKWHATEETEAESSPDAFVVGIPMKVATLSLGSVQREGNDQEVTIEAVARSGMTRHNFVVPRHVLSENGWPHPGSEITVWIELNERT